jgi:hypothetical protein
MRLLWQRYIPYVLRPCGDGQYKFVGDYYLHGFMIKESNEFGCRNAGICFELIYVSLSEDFCTLTGE